MSNSLQPHGMDYIVHGIIKARILEWVAFLFSRRSSKPRNQMEVSCIAGGLTMKPPLVIFHPLTHLYSAVGYDSLILSPISIPIGLPLWLSWKRICLQCRLDSIPGLEDPLEKRKATHSSILAWIIPWTDFNVVPFFFFFGHSEWLLGT